MNNQTVSIRRELSGYVTRNVLSTLGLSVYLLADTYFIANAVGTTGLAALNIVLPLFNLLNGVGLLLGIGGATLFSILKIKDQKASQKIFTQVLIVGIIFGLSFSILGFLFMKPLLYFLGANAGTYKLAAEYLTYILLAAPFFACNYLVLSFIRNDNNPHLSMVAMLVSSLFNIIFDYIFMYPLHLGMGGAAMATAVSPIVALAILTFHRKKEGRLLTLQRTSIHFKTIKKVVQFGFPVFLTEMSTGVSIFAFNLVILSLAGNTAVAAYGIIANIVLVALSLFNGVAQGIQPLLSREFGIQNWPEVKQILRFGLIVSFIIGTILYLTLTFEKDPIIALFNNSNNQELIHYAEIGIPIYFLSLFGSSLNVVFSMFFSAIGEPKHALILAILRGYVLLLGLLFIFAHFFNLTGVWVALPVTELIIVVISTIFLFSFFNKQIKKQ
ncbi:MATE family efflux transporter [Dellaglioa sp. P0083]|uniref:MATE family efflux transporter n=1 Tax=Dellaglioa kimchii TaxID=3344667 RepID=UPI0038D3D8D2